MLPNSCTLEAADFLDYSPSLLFWNEDKMTELQDHPPPPFVVLNFSPPNNEDDVTLTENDVGKNYRVRYGDEVHNIHILSEHVGVTV